MTDPRPFLDNLDRCQDAARNWQTHINNLRHIPAERLPDHGADLFGDPIREHRAKGDAGQRNLLASLRPAPRDRRAFRERFALRWLNAIAVGIPALAAFLAWRHWS